MRKIGLMTLAATLPWMTMFAGMDDQAATLSLPAEIDFTAAEPISGVTLFGKRERLFDGAAYVCAAIKINCLAYQDVVLEFNAKTVGTPAATVGAILYRHESGELKILSRSQWLHPVRAGEYGPVRVEFPGHCVVTDGEYEIYLYRSNQQGALYLDTARISQKPVDKKISFSFLDTPDLVSPLKPGPSGMRDYHLAVTGVNPHKGIKEVVVLTDTQGR